MKHQIELKALKGEILENRFRAVASVCGYPDRGGDVIMPGAFSASVLRDCVANGWLDKSHEWETPIGIITDAKMVGQELHMESEFHSTPEAQEIRTVVKERMDAGKSVSVSIGFMPDYAKVRSFENGADLLKWAKEEGYNESDLDVAAIKKLGWCRAIPSATELFEYSVCTVGMHPKAKGAEVKTFDDQFEEALGCLDSVVARWESIAEKRETLGPSHKAKLSKVVDRLEAIAAKCAPDPDPVTTETSDDSETEEIKKAERQKTLLLRASMIR